MKLSGKIGILSISQAAYAYENVELVEGIVHSHQCEEYVFIINNFIEESDYLPSQDIRDADIRSFLYWSGRN